MRFRLSSKKKPTTELWFEPRQPEDLFAPLAHSVATLVAEVDRESRAQVRAMCAALSRHQQERDSTLVQHAAVRKPAEGSSLCATKTIGGQMNRKTN